MDDLYNIARVLEHLLEGGLWQPQEARALLRAGRALARAQGRPGTFDRLLALHQPAPPAPTAPSVA